VHRFDKHTPHRSQHTHHDQQRRVPHDTCSVSGANPCRAPSHTRAAAAGWQQQRARAEAGGQQTHHSSPLHDTTHRVQPQNGSGTTTCDNTHTTAGTDATHAADNSCTQHAAPNSLLRVGLVAGTDAGIGWWHAHAAGVQTVGCVSQLLMKQRGPQNVRERRLAGTLPTSQRGRWQASAGGHTRPTTKDITHTHKSALSCQLDYLPLTTHAHATLPHAHGLLPHASAQMS
jgi:hypothetical protein